MNERWSSWACPTRLSDSGKVEKVGCGGNWGPVLPDRCPSCKGPLLLTQRLVLESLVSPAP